MGRHRRVPMCSKGGKMPTAWMPLAPARCKGPVPLATWAFSVQVDPAIGTAGDVDTAMVVLRTASGRLCQISNSRRATYGYDQRIEAHGAGGMLRAGNVPVSTVELANASGIMADPVLPFFLERYAAAYRAELDCFITNVASGPNGDDGLAALRLADAATLSAKSGQVVAL